MSSSPHRLHFLDGVRGWAALSVLIFHTTSELFGAFAPSFRMPWLGLLNDGPLAVYVFFVLSGFVLAQRSIRSHDVRAIRSTALGRYVRLTVPIFLSSAVAYLLMKSGLFYNQQAAAIVSRPDWLGQFYGFEPGAVSFLRFTLYDVFFKYDLKTSYNVFLWTMEFELKGSFLVFALLALSGPDRRVRVVWYAVAALLCWPLAPTLSTFVYGMVLAELTAHSRFEGASKDARGDVIGMAFLALAFAYSVRTKGAPDASVHQEAFIAFLIVAAPALSWRLRRAFESGVSKWLGRISFPLYLIHSAVICSAASYAIVSLSTSGRLTPATAAIVSAATILTSFVAAMLFEPVERLAIGLSHRFSRFVLSKDAARMESGQAANA